MSSIDLISKGKSYVSARQSATSKLPDKIFKIRLGKGFYGECLAVRADEISNLSDEIGKQLSVKSAAAGLSYDANRKGEDKGHSSGKEESPPWHLNLIFQYDAQYKRNC